MHHSHAPTQACHLLKQGVCICIRMCASVSLHEVCVPVCIQHVDVHNNTLFL